MAKICFGRVFLRPIIENENALIANFEENRRVGRTVVRSVSAGTKG